MSDLTRLTQHLKLKSLKAESLSATVAIFEPEEVRYESQP